jgi:hypothetical protein
MQILIAAGGSAAAASQAKYESLTAVSILARLRCDELLAIADGASLERLFGFASGSKSALRLVVSRTSGSLFFSGRDDAEGGYCFCTVARTSLTSGEFVTVSVFRTNGAATNAQVIIRQNGTTLENQTSAVAYGALPTGSGNGAINIGNGTYGLAVDAVAVFNRAVTTSDHDTAFTAGTSGLVGGYLFSEGSGSTSADVVSGGTALTLTSVTWDAGGTWDGAAPVFTSLSISNPNTSYTIGTLLDPITVTALDQFGATFLGTLADCSVESLTLPVGVVGTLFEPFVSGIATFDDLTATAGGDVRALLAQPRTANWLRVRVKDAAGTWRDVRSISGADYQVSAVVTRDQEAPASFASVTLRSGTGASAIKPALTTAPANASGRLLDVGREFEIYTTVTDVGAAPSDSAFSLVFQGRIDTIDDTSVDVIRFSGRDGMVAILDAVFGATLSYGTSAGVAVQDVIQLMLTQVLGSGVMTLSTPVSPAWLIVDTPVYTVKIGTSLYAAIKQLTDQIGWRLAINYPSNVPTLQLLGPNRSPTVADWTLAASEIRSVDEVALSLEPIRNRVTVQYRDASGVPQTPVVSESTASIAAYGLRPMVIVEAASSQIRTSTQATRMADAIRVDLSLPLLTYTLTHQHAFWQILPGHVVDVLANSVHFDTTQRLACARTVLTLENGGGSVALSMRGSPASRGRSWLDLSGPTPDIDVTSTDTFASATFSSGGTLRINVIGPVAASAVRAAVSTSGPPSSADVDSATGTLSVGSSMASLTTPGSYTVGTTVYVAARAYIGGVGGRVIQLVVNRDAEAGTLAIGPSLTVRTEFSDTLCTITYVGTGTITVADNGGAYAAAPASPFTRGRAAAGSNTVNTVSIRAELAGQTITNDVTIPPRSTIDTDTVTPDLDVAPVSIPTNGGSAALHVEYVVTATNPKAGGPAPTITATFDASFLTLQRWTGSVWTAVGTGDTLTSGARVRALRPPFGREVQTVTFRAALTGGGAESIQRTVPNQDVPIAPRLKITQVGSTNTSKTLRIATVVGGAQVRWTGGSATLVTGLASGTYGAEPQDYEFARPALGAGDTSALFEALANTVTDADFETISTVDRDTLGILVRAETIAETTTTQTVRVSASTKFADAAGTVTLTAKGTATVVVGGSGSLPVGDARSLTISTADGTIGAGFSVDYVITKPPVGGLPARVSWRVADDAGTLVPDSDAVDVQPVISLVPGRIVVVAVTESGPDLTIRWQAFNASGSEATATADVSANVYATAPGAAEGSPTTPSISRVSGAYQITITRTANSAYRVALTFTPATANGTATTALDVRVPTFMSPTGSGAPRFTGCSVTVSNGPGLIGANITLAFSVADAPAGYTVNAIVDGGSDGVTTHYAISTGAVIGFGRFTSAGGFIINDRIRGQITMQDADGNQIAARAIPSTQYWAA